MGQLVNQTELAAILGKSDVTVWEWQKEGLPIESRGQNGQANQYDTEKVIGWLVAREVLKVQNESQRDRLTRLQADKLEQELLIEKGQLVPVHEVQPIWKSRVLSAAAFLLSTHSRMAALLDASPTVEEKRQVLRHEHSVFLSKLGTNGKEIQAELDAMMEKLGADEAAKFLNRLQDITAAPPPKSDDVERDPPSGA